MIFLNCHLLRVPAFIILLAPIGYKQVIAQESNAPAESTNAWSYHFQYTGIKQYHGGFSAKYSGRNSLRDSSESPYSVTTTLFLGRKLWRGGELFVNPEMSGGSGFSLTTGIAGFPNGEVYRVDDVTPKVFMARGFLRQHFFFGDTSTEKINDDQNQFSATLPRSRLTLTLGKFGITDIFDDNRYSHDPRTQFMNWAVWASGAWDYAADTRGYDWGIAAELHQPAWQLNIAAVMVPSTPNGLLFDMDFKNAYSLNMEFIKPYSLGNYEGNLHLTGFLNHAYMGNYRQAIDEAALTGNAPDIDRTNAYRAKYGFVVSLEQPLSEIIGLFSRASWNDGATETWAYTEIDRSFLLGASVRGDFWNRNEDNAGIAYALNGISQDHRDYLAAGGYGFIIGDGRLNYAPEHVIETYYSFKALSSLWLTLDNQVVINPAYNKDRGPVIEIFGIRGHFEI